MNYLSKLYELGSLPVIRPGTTQKVAVGSTSAVSAAAVGGSGVVRLLSTTDCHVAFGSSPVADATCLFLPANTPEYFACYATDLVAAIADSGTGSLYITPAVEA
jgi:hypothetical protein